MNSYASIRIHNEIYHAGNLDEFLQKFQVGDDYDWVLQIHDFLKDWFSSLQEIELKTSGSTGNPKIFKVSREAMINSAKATISYFNITEKYKAVLCLPASYIAGKMMLVRAIVGGFDLQIIKPSANPFLSINNFVNFMAVTPYQLVNSLETIRKKTIHKIIVGGSAVSPKLEHDLQVLSTEFYETYGMTETISHIALRKINGNDKSDFFEVLPGVEISQDERSCLIIKAPGLFDGALITNDIVELKDPYQFKWLGRFDNVINSGGIKLFPEQIEHKLHSILSGKYIVTSLPDETLGEKVVLIMEGLPLNIEEMTILEGKIEEVLEKYEIPRDIHFIPVFPLTDSNKIIRKELLQFIKQVR